MTVIDLPHKSQQVTESIHLWAGVHWEYFSGVKIICIKRNRGTSHPRATGATWSCEVSPAVKKTSRPCVYKIFIIIIQVLFHWFQLSAVHCGCGRVSERLIIQLSTNRPRPQQEFSWRRQLVRSSNSSLRAAAVSGSDGWSPQAPRTPSSPPRWDLAAGQRGTGEQEIGGGGGVSGK